MPINITDELHAATTKGKIASAKEVFLTGDAENLQQIGEKTHQLEDSIKNIAATGGASTAAAVTFDNAASGMTAVNAQAAIEELNTKNKTQDTEIIKKVDKASIVQEFGESEDKVVSQFALPLRETESPEFIHCIVDSDNHLLFGIQLDGSVEWGKGIPTPIKGKMQEIINQSQQDKTEMSETINTLNGILDKTTIKDDEGAVVETPFHYIQSEEFIFAKVDADNKLLFGIQWDGTPVFGKTSAVEDRLQAQVNILSNRIATILGNDDTTNTIDTLKELKDFFTNINNTQTLTSILANLNSVSNNLGEDIKNLQDTKVDKEEGKSLIEDEVKECFKVIENEEFIMAVVDSEDRLLFGIYRDSGKPYFPLNAMYHVEQNEEFLWVVLDEANHPLLGIRKDGSVDWASGIPSPIRKELSDLHRKTNLPEVINRNRIQESRVYAAVRWNANTKAKDLQFCLVGDPHDPYSKATQNAVEVTNYFRSIEAMIVLGDIQGWTPYDTSLKDRYGIKPFVDILDKCIKPWYLVVGNHDVGPCRYIPFTRSHQQVWEDLIKPMVDRGFLRSNEVNSSNDYASKCYYYHDFNNYKVRLIVLYEYGFPLELEDSNEYWETIDYDESAVDMQLDTTYTYDANKPIVCNCSRYKEHSFKLKKSVTTPHITTENDGKMPQYKFRHFSFFTKEQMEWLASVLLDTPDGYGVIIASHQSLVAPCILTDNKFSRGINHNEVSPRQDGLSADMAMNMAIVPKIVDAWIKKKSVSERVVATYRNIPNDGNPEYLNTETDSDGKYAYKLNLDFSDRINNNAYFINYIAAHEHNDSIEQSVDYPSQKAIIVTTPNPPYRWMSDIATVDDPNCQAYDSLTIYSCNKDRIVLVKYGDDITINGIKRDFEIIKL